MVGIVKFAPGPQVFPVLVFDSGKILNIFPFELFDLSLLILFSSLSLRLHQTSYFLHKLQQEYSNLRSLDRYQQLFAQKQELLYHL